MFRIDKLAHDSALANRHTTAKLLFTLVTLLGALSTTLYPVHAAIFFVCAACAVLLGKTKLTEYLRLYRIPFSFLLMGLIAMVLSVDHDRELFIASVTVGDYAVGISKAGLSSALVVLSRSIACLSATFFLATTTPIHEFLHTLQALHVPSFFTDLCLLMYRFILVFFEELSTMQQAMKLKGGYRTKRIWIQSSASLASQLFFRVFRSVKDWMQVLSLRSFDGKLT